MEISRTCYSVAVHDEGFIISFLQKKSQVDPIRYPAYYSLIELRRMRVMNDPRQTNVVAHHNVLFTT